MSNKILGVLAVSFMLVITSFVSWTVAPNEKVIYKTTEVIKEVEKPIEVERSRTDESTEACKKKGGVPTYSAWNGELNGCLGIEK